MARPTSKQESEHEQCARVTQLCVEYLQFYVGSDAIVSTRTPGVISYRFIRAGSADCPKNKPFYNKMARALDDVIPHGYDKSSRRGSNLANTGACFVLPSKVDTLERNILADAYFIEGRQHSQENREALGMALQWRDLSLQMKALNTKMAVAENRGKVKAFLHQMKESETKQRPAVSSLS